MTWLGAWFRVGRVDICGVWHAFVSLLHAPWTGCKRGILYCIRMWIGAHNLNSQCNMKVPFEIEALLCRWLQVGVQLCAVVYLDSLIEMMFCRCSHSVDRGKQKMSFDEGCLSRVGFW